MTAGQGRAGAGTPAGGHDREGGKPSGRSTGQILPNPRSLRYRRAPVGLPRDFADFAIEVPVGTAREVRVACPQCGPTHRHPRDKVLSVNTAEGVWHCFRCGWKGSLRLRRVPDPVRFAPPPPPPAPDARKAERLARTWRESFPLTDPRAELGRSYLRARGLEDLVAAGDLPGADVLRLHPRLAYFESSEGGRLVGEFPALVARVLDPKGRPATLHRTFLAPDGSSKAPVASPKKLSSPARVNALRGAAVRLFPAIDRLAVAEGIETALAVRVLTGLPVWSAVSAHGLETLALPQGLAALTVAGDHDPNGIGERAAHALAQRAKREGIPTVTVSVPARVGFDWLDVLNRKATP